MLDVPLDARIRASSLIYKIKPGKAINMSINETNELQGYYIHPDLFHDVCYWAKKPYAVKVSAECEIERFTSYSLRPSLTSME